MNRVLIVDDEPLIRSSLSKKVGEYGDSAAVSGCACNGAEALHWLKEYYADICITDVRMPVMDGLALIGAIAEAYPWMACLIVSSYDDFNYARQGIKLGVVDYIMKPVDQALLNEALEKACRRVFAGRLDQAREMLLNAGHDVRGMRERWAECISSGQAGLAEELAGSTAGLLAGCAGSQFHLLESFSAAWLQVVVEELRKDKIPARLDVERIFRVGPRALRRADAPGWFTECAEKMLRAGVMELAGSAGKAAGAGSRGDIVQIKEYIQANFAKHITLQQLAEHVCMSRTYVSNLFRNETGMTIWNYLLTVRMDKAAELLKTTSLKVYEVAERSGYDNNMRFNQVFKEYYGVSPLEYRRQPVRK